MSKRSRWLQDQISAWLDEGLIDADLAGTLRSRYPVGSQEIPWNRIIVSSIGAIVFGLGIILFFAYNWADMHKYVKLALVIGAVAAAHGAGFHVAGREDARRGLVESLHVLGTMLFGAGIWLVAQIYHIDEHYPNAFFVWGLGALALAWAMPSMAQGLMAVLLVFLWGCFEVFDFSAPNHVGPWIVLFGIVPLAWRQRSRVLLFFSLAAFVAMYLFSVGRVDGDLIVAALFYAGCLYMAAGRLSARSRFPESAPVFGLLGFGIYIVMLYAFSFHDVTDELIGLEPDDAIEWAYVLVPLVAALVAWCLLLATGAWQRADVVRRWEVSLVLVALTLVVLVQIGVLGAASLVVALLFNLVLLAHSIILIVRGTSRLDWKQVSFGCILISALAFARFVDLFDSLLMRSLFFLALGAGLFIVGNFYSRRKKLKVAADA